jgi:hypothetical protein
VGSRDNRERGNHLLQVRAIMKKVIHIDELTMGDNEDDGLITENTGVHLLRDTGGNFKLLQLLIPFG